MDKIILTSISKDELEDLITNSVKKVISESTKSKADDLLTENELCEKLNRSKTTLWQWRKKGLLPFRRINRKIYYLWNEVLEALKKVEIREIDNHLNSNNDFNKK